MYVTHVYKCHQPIKNCCIQAEGETEQDEQIVFNGLVEDEEGDENDEDDEDNGGGNGAKIDMHADAQVCSHT